MIQRIQSVYLALVLLTSCTMFFVPLSLFIPENITTHGIQSIDIAYKLNVIGLSKVSKGVSEIVNVSYLMIALNVTVGVIGVLALFMFKDRKKQILLCRVNLVVISLFTGFIFWTEDQAKTTYNADIIYLVGTYLPVAQLIITYLAERAIKKDDDLVKSADRLR